MPEFKQDLALQIASLEREFRILKWNIIGTATAGKLALNDPGAVSLFEACLEAAVTDFEQLQNAWKQLWSLHTLAGTTPTEEWEKGYDASHNEIIVAKSCLKDIQREQASIEASQTKFSFESPSTRSTLATPLKPHLSPIPVPHFSGDWLKWPHFRDTFYSIVHNDPALSDIERLHYLLGALSGEAASLVSKFTVEEKSYALAWKRLKDNYDNPRVMASLFLKRILESDIKESKPELQRYEHFLTHVADSIEGFRSLSLEDPAEFLLGSLALKALDPQIRRNFELSRNDSNAFPTADDVIRFVRQRKTAITMSRDFSTVQTASNLNLPKRATVPRFPNRSSPKYRAKYDSVALHSSNNFRKFTSNAPRSQHPNLPSSKPPKGTLFPTPRLQHQTQDEHSNFQTCPFCQGNHSLAGCFKFSDCSRADRTEFVRSLKCCRNCLRLGHSVAECKSKWTCRFCKMKHHSLIHEDVSPSHHNSTLLSTQSQTGESSSNIFNGLGSEPFPSCSTLLGTAEVLVLGHEDQWHPIRAVLDSGSQQTFISLSLANRIDLPLTPFNGSITGLGGSLLSKPVGTTVCWLTSRNNNAKYQTQALVVNTVTPPLPNFAIPQDKVRKLRSHKLADTQFCVPGAIDILIGMDLYPLLINGTPFHSGVDQLFFLPTVFGLVVIGKLENVLTSHSVALFTESQTNIEDNLKAFWEIEEPKPVNRQSPEDQLCEDHFVKTTSRTPDGRYMVRLPLVPSHKPLGRNRELVMKRFLNLEHKFKADQLLAEQYFSFMQEYREMNHFTPAVAESDYLIPHHGVWQERPSGKKLRVVFDASCTSSTTQSLNSLLMAGPKLQSDIGDVLINFRLFWIPLCADLVKMYRQIMIHPDDRHYQHVLWRNSHSDAVVEMELNTVTYGLRSSAYQAQRVVQQLAIDEGNRYPLAVRAISTSMYVDDIVSGADTMEEAQELQRQLIALFAKGGFSLSKWASTAAELMRFEEKVEPLQLTPCNSESVKILGLIWNPINDSFSYSVSTPPVSNLTKRTILSTIARIFDPLGLVAPIVLPVKVLLQDIWKYKLDWDQPVPQDIKHDWKSITREWNLIPHLSVPRYISLKQVSYQLVGFCDASSKAYAASVYLRVESPGREVKSTLLKAKTKVAPIKYTSIARLELCGALLLIRLLSSITASKLKESKPICFTDSSVVLSWLRIPTYQLKVFEANRVSEILNTTSPESWRHVKSEENPSDIASRGCLPSVLHGNKLWWHGPSWLLQPTASWPQSQHVAITPSALRSSNVTCLSSSTTSFHELASRFSNYHTLIRTVARILRLLSAVRSPQKRLTGPVTAEEFMVSKMKCIRLSQDKLDLKQFGQLSPFFDELGIIRVGGRLQSAPMPVNSKHPMLLPRNCHLSSLICRDIHQRHYHSGPSLTLALLRCEFWIPGALKLIRSVIARCIHCRLQRAQPVPPVMAQLPKERFSQVRAFLHVGLDYAGPFFKNREFRKNL